MERDRNSRLVYSTDAGRVSAAAQEPEALSPSRSGVRLRLDRRASGRVVTLVSGLPGPAAELLRLVKELKTACGAGGSLKEGVIELQGDQRDKVEAVLRARGVASKRAGG